MSEMSMNGSGLQLNTNSGGGSSHRNFRLADGTRMPFKASNPLKNFLSPFCEVNRDDINSSLRLLKEFFEPVWIVPTLGCETELGEEVMPESFIEQLPTSTCVLLEGKSGAGKTTFASHLVAKFGTSDWLPSLKSILYFDMSLERVCEAKEWEDLPHQTRAQRQKTGQELSHSSAGGNENLIIVDTCEGFGELLKPNSILKAIFDRKLLPNSKILILSRPSNVENVKSGIKIDYHYHLKGFTRVGVRHFITTKCTCSDDLLTFLGNHKLDDICENPNVCSILVSAFNSQRSKQEITLSAILNKLLFEIVRVNLYPEEKMALGHGCQIQLRCLPETAEVDLAAVCLLACEHMLCGRHKCNNKTESQQFLSSFSLKLSNSSMKNMFRLGLVDLCPLSHAPCAYEFLHPLLLEFLAALHLYKQPPLDQLVFLSKNTRSLFQSGFKAWLRFFFCLLREDHAAHSALFNPTKLMMNTIIDVLVDSLELNHEAEYRYHLIVCIHEVQEKSLFRKLVLKHPAILSFSINAKEFVLCIEPVLSLITSSGYEEWIISTSLECEKYANELNEQARGVSIAIVTDNLEKERINVSPKRSPAAVTKMYADVDNSMKELTEEEKAKKLDQFCCRAVKEILQKFFALYSTVKIKGDATHVSYVSFLTCGCFKESFLKHIQFFPIQPIHFIAGPKKDLTKLSKESLTATDRHNLEKHNGESNEIIIMLRPSLQKMEGVVPGTDDKFLLLFSHTLSSFSQESPNVSDTCELVAVQACLEGYDINGPSTELVLPPLPIVRATISQRLAQTAYPKPCLPPTQVIKIETTPQSTIEGKLLSNNSRTNSQGNVSSTTLNPTVQTQLHVESQVQVPFAGSQAPSTNQLLLSDCLKVNRQPLAQTVGGTSVQASPGAFVYQKVAAQATGEVQVQPATSRRQTALRPGTVLYTSLPDKIPSDQIQPLPLQQTLIRKGGNGSIFSENVSGTAMAVKKTSYRSKEYAIITKIRHKNIVPLLAYVWGEEHRENKRRYYVYHYLPKLSGDLARLVTDKEELSLYEFNKMNCNNLRAMGVAVGNIKYTLSQVLQGLQYLHSAHIAHRDLKASNTLIKFFCGCASPLECACEVVLCDFDAAIELDSNDRVPLTPSPPSRPHTGASSHVEIVPVGTNGFRSPESSMLTLANTPEAFSPPLTTKTDIYSFGILCMRLMISTDTPYSQRTMATLLLHYHQLKGLNEGRIGRKLSKFHKLDKETTRSLAGREWPDFLRVDEATVLKILKLKKLRPRMGWLRRGFDFVSQCLSVDPEARPSATDLLKDPFLNSSYS